MDVSYETIRRWTSKFGQAYGKRIQHGRPRPSSVWHIDEVFLKIGDRQMYRWRAVDDEGEVLDVLPQSRRNETAAIRLLRRLIKRQGTVPSTIVSDNWRPTAAAIRRSCQMLTMFEENDGITAARTHINRREDENESCSASKHRRPRRLSSRLSRKSTTSSTSNDTSFLGQP